jgi:bacterial/archaeal transporter family-2 protein
MSLFLFSVFLGTVIAVHLAMNARVGEILGSPGTGNALFWGIGALMGLVIWLAWGDWAAIRNVGTVPPALWLAGAMGASLVLGIAFVMPRLGVGPTTVGLVLGQVICGALLSHFGWLSQPIRLDPMKSAGIVTMLVGVWMVIR